MMLLVVVSWFTNAPDPERIKWIIWTWQEPMLPECARVTGVSAIFSCGERFSLR
jgi:hypothetical protein